MNPLLCQLSYAADRGDNIRCSTADKLGAQTRTAGSRVHDAITLLMVKIGSKRAKATEPMIMPMMMIMAGSM